MSIDLSSLDISIPSDWKDLSNDDVTISSEFTSSFGNNVIQRCIVTCFPPDKDDKWLLPNTYFNDLTVIQNWCGQFEITPDTNCLHFHLYIEFVNKSKKRFKTILEIFRSKFESTVNISVPKHRKSKKSVASCVNYVLAPDKRAPETNVFIWQHNKDVLQFNQNLWMRRDNNKNCSKTEKDKAIIDYIESKPKFWDYNRIVHETYESKLLLGSCGWGAKYHAGRHCEVPRRKIANVIILYGAGGTGKSTLARFWDVRTDEPFEERYYLRNYDDGNFWGCGKTAYKSQRIIHLEEFSGQLSASSFKQVCDIGAVGPAVNVKNSSSLLNHDTVIITSNTHPAGWYHNLCTKDPKQWLPLVRRFTQVWFFPEHRDNGEPNIAGPNIEPYYVDQTEAFLSMTTSFQQAIDHANTHWPLQDQDVEINGSMCTPGFFPNKKLRHY